MLRRTLLALTLSFACVSAPAADQAKPVNAVGDHENALARELLEVSGAMKMSSTISMQIVEMLKQSRPVGEHALIDRMGQRMDVSELESEMVRIHTEHFTAHELEQLVAFFQSSTGRKYLAEAPVMMRESMEVGRRWGERNVAELAAELDAEAAKQKAPAQEP